MWIIYFFIFIILLKNVEMWIREEMGGSTNVDKDFCMF